jgi:hypothetical protein
MSRLQGVPGDRFAPVPQAPFSMTRRSRVIGSKHW